MRGGNFVGIQQGFALRTAGAMLLAIHFTWASGWSMLNILAHPVEGEEHCKKQSQQEQSIVISAKKLLGSEVSPVKSDTAEATLQPIAKVSEYEPDLAEPLRVAQVPTLASTVNSTGTINSAEKVKEKIKGIDDSVRTKAKKREQQPGNPGQKPVSGATTVEPEAISFHGITPGVSKRIEVLRTWGDPRSDDTQASVLLYRFDKLPSVKVYFDESRVDAIEVKLAKPQSTVNLRSKLKVQQLRPVLLTDSQGVTVAEIYPERGLVMRYAAEEQGLAIVSDQDTAEESGPRIAEIVIQPIEANPFLLRADENSDRHFSNAIADLQSALHVDRTLGDARLKLSKVYLKTGKAVTAERYAAEAVELEPRNATYRLQWAKCLRQLARYDRAVEEVRQVLETPNIAPLVRAQGLNEMGLLASLGSQKVARRAIPLHTKAIEIADAIAVGDDPLVRRPAKKLLVDAHLAVAVQISRGAWQQKELSVPQWIERASALAESLIAEDKNYLPLRLQIAVSSLAAAANLEKPINPLLWIEEAEDTAAEINKDLTDTLAISQIDWQLGLAYFHGSQIEHRRSKPESAIYLGELADQQLSELAKNRDEMPNTSYLMGRLYFQIGAVHAVHHEDHATACQWYDQAVDRLLNPVPVTMTSAPQQHGDTLVSMGVSYWNQDDRRRAIEVTEAGVELIEQAVSSDLLEVEALMVSYNNLAAMYEAQGEVSSAVRFERLAQEITGSKVSQRR